MKPIILKADQDGKLLITVDEIQKMVEDAYNEGVADGKASVPAITSLPYQPGVRNERTIDPNTFRWDLTCKGD